MQQHGSIYFTRRPPPPPDPGGGVNRVKKLFENIFMLHIKLKGNMKGSNLVANVLPADQPVPHDPRGWGQ